MSVPTTVGPGQVRTVPGFADRTVCKGWIDAAWANQGQWKKRFDYIHSYGRAWYLEIEYGMLHSYHAFAADTNGLLAGLDGLVPRLASASRLMEAPDGTTGHPARARRENLGPYWADAGVIAMTRGTAGMMHADYEGLAPYPSMMFDEQTRAYSAVLMLSKPTTGGDLKVWTKRFLGNVWAKVDDLPTQIATYDTGTLAVFDSFCYHQILESTLTEESPYRAVAAMHFVYLEKPTPHFEYWY